MAIQRLYGSLLLSLMIVCQGCTTLSPSATSVLRDPGRLIGKPRVEKNVARIVCLWEPAQGSNVEGKSARGFAGQILFFGPASDAAARVFGEVRIHQYDRYDPDGEDQEPLHTFTFTPEAWEVHRSESSLGHGYNVFIPYMQKHRDPVNCGVKVEFVLANGGIVSSDTTEIMLAGKKRMGSVSSLQHDVTSTRQSRASELRAGSVTPDPAKDEQEAALQTMTITLPKTSATK